MNWMPAFKGGIWNGWILMLFYPLIPLMMRLIDKAVGSGGINQKMGEVPTDQAQKRANRRLMILIYMLAAYSIFLPLKLGMAWFYAGVLLYLLGLITLFAALVHAAATPAGQLFSRGVYRYSRHPMYLGFMLAYSGVGIATASWLFLVITGIYAKMIADQAEVEEHGCLATFGAGYQEYMRRTPKWIGLPR